MSALQQFGGRRLLFLNWRDLTNPAAGGAEAYAEQIARRFAAAGAEVTLFASEYDDAQPHDWENDYLVVRRGGRFGVYAAAAHHLSRYGRRYDAVVDFQNGIPFFSPLWAPKGTVIVCVVHHVHQEQFDSYFRWPINHVGRFLEGPVSRRVYGWRPFVAVSPSTRAEMRTQLRLRGPIHIVPNGAQPLPASRVPRSPDPVIAVVTRLVPHKRLHLLVEAMPPLLRRWPGLRLQIGGTGPAREQLVALAADLRVERAVSLPGRVTEQDKSNILGAAWLTAMPSLAEGWGLTVIEANALGTPAVGYDVPGLRDSIRNGRTGWLVPASADLASVLATALGELQDTGRRNVMADQCRRWAAAFSWDSSAERLAGLLLSEIRDRELRRPGRRSVVDLCTVAFWPADQADEDLERRLRKALGMNDVITRHAAGLSVLMCGCDEVAAAAALRRAQVPPARLRLATSTAVLSGSDGDEIW